MNVKRTLASLIAAAALLLPASTVGAQAGCGFTLGFQTLRDLAGHEVVGECLENEHFNPGNGNAEQATTRGLLVWRKADNWTAFTDGYRTWLNGPNGIEVRLNTQRFPWEAPVVPPTPTPPVVAQIGQPCSPEGATAPRLGAPLLCRSGRWQIPTFPN